MSDSAENDVIDVIDTEITEWAIQCFTRDGDVYTGSAYTTRNAAEASGERLARINGAEWWLITRRRAVTVRTSPWTSVTPPEEPVQ